MTEVTTSRDRIHVFVSSRMGELRDLRAILRSELEAHGIDAFVYEATLGSHPGEPEQVSLQEVGRTDLFVLVIGESHGEITEREYDKARELAKPCLVYERLGPRSDPQLERFLKKLSGARGVPSRTSFETAVDLAKKVARDVQAWLVREYRRLSAAQVDTDQSSRRSSDLASSMKRLSASSRQVLPSGTSADLLAWQLQQWFEALEYPLDEAPITDTGYTDLVVRVPIRRKQYSRVLVRAKDGAIQSPDVAEARSAATSRGLDEVWLVSFRRISPAARKAAESTEGVILYTLDDLIDEDVDFGRYFEWLDKQVEAASIDRLYVSLAVTVNEVDASGVVHAQSTYEDVASYVDQWLEDVDGEHLSLLGEFGTGKSWFALKYAHDTVTKYRAAQQQGGPRPRVPLVVRLRDYARGFKDVGALLTEFVFREHQINIPSFAVLETLNRMGRLLFIFDGFDEMAARVDQQKMVDNFWSLAGVLGAGSKAVLTCRTEYFQFASQARELFGGRLRGSAMSEIVERIRFQVATLQMFDERRLRQVLSRRSGDARLIDAVMANQRLVDLGSRPVMVDLLIEAMPELHTESADLSHVYYKAVQRKMERDIDLGRTFTTKPDKMFFMCEISWEMVSTQRLKIHYKEVPERIREYFGASSGTVEEDYWRHDLLSQTMLVRDDDGNYLPAHKSLVEFFAAYKLSAQLGALHEDFLEAVRAPDTTKNAPGADQRWSEYFRRAGGDGVTRLGRFRLESKDPLISTWGRLSLDNATSEFIASLCGKKQLVAAITGLHELGGGTGTIAARALEVLAFGGDTPGLDLSGVEFEGSTLRDCNLSDAVLPKTTWRGCAFDHVVLDGATLKGGTFSGGRFSQVTFRGTDLSDCTFDGVGLGVNVAVAAWGSYRGEHVLVAMLGDGRIAAIAPLSARIEPLNNEGAVVGDGVVNAVLNKTTTTIGDLTLVGGGWLPGRTWYREETRAQFETSWTGPRDYDEVQRLHVRVSDPDGNIRLSVTVEDGTDLDWGSADFRGVRALCIGREGRWVAVVAGKKNEPERAKLLRSGEDELANSGTNAGTVLQHFEGEAFRRGPQVFDLRGAAASPDDEIVAIAERPNLIAFWRTQDGSFIGRAVFTAAATGAHVDNVSGLPELLRVNPDEPHGWSFQVAGASAHQSSWR